MGHDTFFHGTLEFTRRLNADELDVLQDILDAGRYRESDRHLSHQIFEIAKEERDERGGGPVVIFGSMSADYRAGARGFITGDDLDPSNASGLRITEDGKGLEYRSEKSYYMVEGVNFIIVNAQKRIPYFGLKGMLAADTEFEPYYWFLKIGEDGLAHQERATMEEFLAFRRKVYPEGYRGFGLIDPADKSRNGTRRTTFWDRLKTKLHL